MSITQSTKELPPTYVQSTTLDLSQDKKAFVLLNVLGVVVMLLTGWFLIWLTPMLRPEPSLELTIQGWLIIPIFLVALAGITTLHEAIHGVFFWLFTRERPTFGFKGVYAYAASPAWYMPRNAYLIVGLAPVVFITTLGVALLPVLPYVAVVPTMVLLAAHAGGAAGDLYVTFWCLMKPNTILMRDVGDAITMYEATN